MFSRLVLIFVLFNSVFVCVIEGIYYQILTHPVDLAFEKYSNVSSRTRSMYFIQPSKTGFLDAQLGGVESRHDYNMSSISVFLSSHRLEMHGNDLPKLFVLCVVENAHLIARRKALLMCNLEVIIPALGDHVLSSSSCLIHCAKEAECTAEIDLEFMRRQAKVSLSEKSELLLFYNVTALDSASFTQSGGLVERDDVTNSLIYKHMKLPTVTIVRRPDTETVTLLTDVHGFPILQLDVPGTSTSNFFDLQILQTAEAPLRKFKMHLLFSSELRFLWAKEQGRDWRLHVKPTPQGVTVRLRLRGSPNTDASETTVDETADRAASYYPPNLPEPDITGPRHQKAVPIGFLRFERVSQQITEFDRAQALGVSPAGAYSSEEDDEVVVVDSGSRSRLADYVLTPEPGFITVGVSQVDWVEPPDNASASARPISSPASVTAVRLPIPAAPPDPSDMYIFVQFQPVDMLEPPWSPSREPPPPRKLKVFGLVPSTNPSSPFPPAFKAYGISGPQTAGRLLHLTNQVFCRPLTGLTSQHMGGLSLSSATLPITRRAQSSCPFQMREAPAELELYSTGRGDQPEVGSSGGGSGSILLALRRVAANGARVIGDSPHIAAARFTSVWSWWAWRGPTVRLWQFEGIRVRLQSNRLRQIPNLLLPVVAGGRTRSSCAPAFEHTKITVTARLYTTLPGTGERMYLSDMEDVERRSARMAVGLDANRFSNEYEHLVHQPVELDVTRVLPAWALRLTQVADGLKGPPEALRGDTTALIYWNPRNGYPYLIGQRAGHVRVEVLATPQDPQPLAQADVEITDTVLNKFVALRAECVSWMITLSGRLEPHPSAEQTLHAMPEVYSSETSENPSQPLLSNEQDMTADFTMPHPRILMLDVRGRDPNEPKVVTDATDSANFLLDANGTISSNSVVCPMGKVSLTLRMADGTDLLLHELPRGQVRVSATASSVSGAPELVWDPADLLKIGPLTEEGKALVSTGKLGLGPLVDMNEITLWPASESCRPRPFIAIGRANLGAQKDPGPAKQVFDWEEAAIRKYREYEAGHLEEAKNLQSQAQFVRSSQFHTSKFSVDTNSGMDSAAGDTSFVKQILLGIVAFSVVFLAVNFIVVIALRRHRARRRKLARIQEDLCDSTKEAFNTAPPPNSASCFDAGGSTSVVGFTVTHSRQQSALEASQMQQHYMASGSCDQRSSTVSGYNPMTNGGVQADMNAGLSCSSVFSAGSGGSKQQQQQQQQNVMYSFYSNQNANLNNIDTPPPMTLMNWVANSNPTAGACGVSQAWGSSQGSNGSRSLHSDTHGSPYGPSHPHMPYPMPNHPEKNHSAYVPRDHSKGLLSGSFKWQSSGNSQTYPDNTGSVPSSMNTGSPIHDDGFVSGPIENPSAEGSNSSTIFFPPTCEFTGRGGGGRMPLPSQIQEVQENVRVSSHMRYCDGGGWAPTLLRGQPMLPSPSCGCHLLQNGSPHGSHDAATRSSPSMAGEIARGSSFSNRPSATSDLPSSPPGFSCMERSGTTVLPPQNGHPSVAGKNRLNIPSTNALKGLSAKLQAAKPSKSATAMLPPRLTLAHDPNVLGSKYHTETSLTNLTPPQYPSDVLLSPEIVKDESNFTDGCFVGENQVGNDGTQIDAATAFADSGRESQEKSSSSANSADAVQDLPAPVDGDGSSSEMDFQVAQVDV